MPQHHPIATWSPDRDLWEGEEDIFGHSVVFSETLPKRGMTVGGRLYELPMSAPHTTERGCSSSPHLPTPVAGDGDRERNNPSQARRKSPPLSAVTHILPTPRARDGKGKPSPGFNEGNLPTVTETFSTPKASDATGGGQHPDKRVGHTLQLIDQVLSIGVSTAPQSGGGSA